MQLTKAQAGNYLLHLHFSSRGQDLMAHVDGLKSLQYDPLDVVGRNPDLVLQSRIRNYNPKLLYDALYKDRLLMDGFDKCLCIYPVRDFPCYERMRRIEGGWAAAPEVVACYPAIRAQIEARGPLCSDDFEQMDHKVNWPWGPTKLARAALESYWLSGGLILSHKKGARRYYDLIENHIPGEILAVPDPYTDDDEHREWLLYRRIQSVGLMWNRGSDAFLGINGFTADARIRAFSALEEKGALIRINVDDIAEPLFVPTDHEQVLHSSLAAAPDKAMRIIAPLDNLMWDRKLIEAIFGFKYRWEVYVPKDKREYGYYVLPVVQGGRFVARFEPEHFRGGEFVIKNWWWEAGVRRTKALIAERERALKRFCRYLGADGVAIDQEH